MMTLCSDVLNALQGKTLVTAESLTGGGIGQVLTSVPGSSSVYKGGIISYTNWVKHNVLGVEQHLLDEIGAVSAPVALQMAEGVRKVLQADVAISVTGLAGPDADEFGNPVGTVYIGYADNCHSFALPFHFLGDREAVRTQTITEALKIILKQAK